MTALKEPVDLSAQPKIARLNYLLVSHISLFSIGK